jgi:peptidoglycan/LPS O-acetylase OafA/YrhL
LFVVLYHVYIQIFPISLVAQSAMQKLFVFNGLLAVVLFFVVSGYSLSIGFLQTNDLTKLKRIAIGRYFRLSIPILLACLLVFLCVILGLIPREYAPPSARNVLDLVRFALYGVYFEFDIQSAPITPLWTMRFELLGSVIVLSTLAAFNKSKYRFFVYAALGTALYMMYPLAAAFIVGIILAELRPEVLSAGTATLLSKMAIVGLVPSLIAAAWLPGSDLHFWVLVGSALAFCLTCNAQVRKALSGRLSVFLGKISFPLYLLHALFIRVVGMPLLARATSPIEIAGADALVVMGAIVIAWLFRGIDTAGVHAARSIGNRLISPRHVPTARPVRR